MMKQQVCVKVPQARTAVECLVEEERGGDAPRAERRLLK